MIPGDVGRAEVIIRRLARCGWPGPARLVPAAAGAGLVLASPRRRLALASSAQAGACRGRRLPWAALAAASACSRGRLAGTAAVPRYLCGVHAGHKAGGWAVEGRDHDLPFPAALPGWLSRPPGRLAWPAVLRRPRRPRPSRPVSEASPQSRGRVQPGGPPSRPPRPPVSPGRLSRAGLGGLPCRLSRVGPAASPGPAIHLALAPAAHCCASRSAHRRSLIKQRPRSPASPIHPQCYSPQTRTVSPRCGICDRQTTPESDRPDTLASRRRKGDHGQCVPLTVSSQSVTR
jgi:hypothetical protein